RDHRFEGPFFPEGGGKLGAKHIQIGLGPRLFETLGFDQASELADLLRNSSDALRYGFELESQLSALSAKGFYLQIRIGEFSLQTPCFAVRTRQSLLRLRQLVAKARDRRHGVKNCDARFFLLLFEFGQRGCSGSGFLLRKGKFVL